MAGRVEDCVDLSGRESWTGLVGEDEAAALNLAMFALGSPRGGDLDLSRSTAMDLVDECAVCIGGRVGIELTFPGMLCESCVCEEGPRERGTGGSDGRCLGIHGFSCSNHPSCSRRLFLVIEHHEYRCRMSCSVDIDYFPSSGACFVPNQFVWNLESRRTRLPATLRDLTCRALTAWGPLLGAHFLVECLTLFVSLLLWRHYSCLYIIFPRRLYLRYHLRPVENLITNITSCRNSVESWKSSR